MALRPILLSAALGSVLVPVLVGCRSGDVGDGGSGGGRPEIVVTTAILGDVVREVVGDLATVSVVMPDGAAPHEFEASAKDIAAVNAADVVVANGANFEEGLADPLAAAAKDGVAVYDAIGAVPTLTLVGDEAADHDGIDPHFFTDPHRMALAVDGLVPFLEQHLATIDRTALERQAATYRATLDALDASITAKVQALPADRRKLVTNHEVFSYFADRYGFEIIGAIIPGGSSQGEPDAAALAELAGTIRSAGVPAIFADTSSPEQLADALASEAGDVRVVSLFSESLGSGGSGADTYVGMMATDADRIVEALS